MANDDKGVEGLQARIDAVIEELRAARQRLLVTRGIAMWNRAEAAHRAMTGVKPPPPEIVH